MFRAMPLALLLAVLLLAPACDDDDGGDGAGDAGAETVPAASATPRSDITRPPTARPLSTPTPAATPDISATIALSADPPQINCDGATSSTVTARVLDRTGVAVEDGTEVTFSVQALGTADPIDTVTSGGIATTRVTALGRMVGVVVNVTSGPASAAIRVDCL
jgi:hypothetical protein